MPDEDLQWLTFSYAGKELVPGGDDIEVTPETYWWLVGITGIYSVGVT